MAAKLFFASEHVQGVTEVSTKCHREVKENIKEKGTVTKSQIFVCGGLEIFSKKSSHRENAQTIYLYINSLPKIACSVLKALSIMNVFSLTIHHSTQRNLKSIATAIYGFIFPVEKNIHHLRASFFAQRPMIIIANLKKYRPVGLLLKLCLGQCIEKNTKVSFLGYIFRIKK